MHLQVLKMFWLNTYFLELVQLLIQSDHSAITQIRLQNLFSRRSCQGASLLLVFWCGALIRLCKILMILPSLVGSKWEVNFL